GISITNGAKKYSLNKQLYETKQENKTVSEYYTNMRILWMELEDLNIIPAITNITPKANAFIQALNKQIEELKLFHLLSGLDEQYGAQRSQIFMMSKLPTVDEACNIIQQEESQREVFKQEKGENDGMVMHIKKNEQLCSNYGKPGHSYDKCWTIVGYPAKGIKNHKGIVKETQNKSNFRKYTNKGNQKWGRYKSEAKANMAT
ncbi:Phosphoenolpyruvate carboxylase, partial [Bienertia sinuspersici]